MTDVVYSLGTDGAEDVIKTLMRVEKVVGDSAVRIRAQMREAMGASKDSSLGSDFTKQLEKGMRAALPAIDQGRLRSHALAEQLKAVGVSMEEHIAVKGRMSVGVLADGFKAVSRDIGTLGGQAAQTFTHMADEALSVFDIIAKGGNAAMIAGIAIPIGLLVKAVIDYRKEREEAKKAALNAEKEERDSINQTVDKMMEKRAVLTWEKTARQDNELIVRRQAQAELAMLIAQQEMLKHQAKNLDEYTKIATAQRANQLKFNTDAAALEALAEQNKHDKNKLASREANQALAEASQERADAIKKTEEELAKLRQEHSDLDDQQLIARNKWLGGMVAQAFEDGRKRAEADAKRKEQESEEEDAQAIAAAKWLGGMKAQAEADGRKRKEAELRAKGTIDSMSLDIAAANADAEIAILALKADRAISIEERTELRRQQNAIRARQEMAQHEARAQQMRQTEDATVVDKLIAKDKELTETRIRNREREAEAQARAAEQAARETRNLAYAQEAHAAASMVVTAALAPMLEKLGELKNLNRENAHEFFQMGEDFPAIAMKIAQGVMIGIGIEAAGRAASKMAEYVGAVGSGAVMLASGNPQGSAVISAATPLLVSAGMWATLAGVSIGGGAVVGLARPATKEEKEAAEQKRRANLSEYDRIKEDMQRQEEEKAMKERARRELGYDDETGGSRAGRGGSRGRSSIGGGSYGASDDTGVTYVQIYEAGAINAADRRQTAQAISMGVREARANAYTRRSMERGAA